MGPCVQLEASRTGPGARIVPVVQLLWAIHRAQERIQLKTAGRRLGQHIGVQLVLA
jgi:hypothetical protein